jgi:hypothetical protein
MSVIDNVVKEIMDTMPIQQLRVDAQAHLRTKIFTIVFKHTAVSREDLYKKIEDLDRQLYIAQKKVEDEAVDTAGFNK